MTDRLRHVCPSAWNSTTHSDPVSRRSGWSITDVIASFHSGRRAMSVSVPKTASAGARTTVDAWAEPVMPPTLSLRTAIVKLSFEDLTSDAEERTLRPMGDRAAKNALYEGFAEVAKALASGRRAEVVDVLAQGERSVDEIASEIDQSVANTSHHLRAMARAGLLTTRRDGTRIYYALASERVGELWKALRDVAAEHVAGIERLAGAYLGNRDGVEVVDRDELAARLKRG